MLMESNSSIADNAFHKHLTGWVKDGKAYGSPLYDHINLLIKLLKSDSKAKKFIDEYNQAQNDMDSEIDDPSVEHEGGAEWHSFEMALDNAEDDLLEYAFKSGLIRVGVNKQAKDLYFQSTQDVLDNNKSSIYRIVKEVGNDYTANLEPLQKSITGRWKL